MTVYLSTRPKIKTPFLDSDKQECHITLAYFADAEHRDMESLRAQVLYYMQAINSGPEWEEFPIACAINGFLTWVTPDGYVLAASVRSEGNRLNKFRDTIADYLDLGHYDVDDRYTFIPHISIQWSDNPHTTMPELTEPAPFVVDNLYLSYKDNEGTWHNVQVW